MRELQVPIWLEVVQKLETNVLLGTKYIEKYIRRIYPMDLEIVPGHSAAGPIPKTGKEAKKSYDIVAWSAYQWAEREAMIQFVRLITMPAETESLLVVDLLIRFIVHGRIHKNKVKQWIRTWGDDLCTIVLNKHQWRMFRENSCA